MNVNERVTPDMLARLDAARAAYAEVEAEIHRLEAAMQGLAPTDPSAVLDWVRERQAHETAIAHLRGLAETTARERNAAGQAIVNARRAVVNTRVAELRADLALLQERHRLEVGAVEAEIAAVQGLPVHEL